MYLKQMYFPVDEHFITSSSLASTDQAIVNLLGGVPMEGPEPTEKQKVRNMLEGRFTLYAGAEIDYGFDLQDWRRYRIEKGSWNQEYRRDGVREKLEYWIETITKEEWYSVCVSKAEDLWEAENQEAQVQAAIAQKPQNIIELCERVIEISQDNPERMAKMQQMIRDAQKKASEMS